MTNGPYLLNEAAFCVFGCLVNHRLAPFMGAQCRFFSPHGFKYRQNAEVDSETTLRVRNGCVAEDMRMMERPANRADS